MAMLWLGLVLIQVLLGAATTWSNKAADVATLHVLTGALLLATGAMLTVLCHGHKVEVGHRAPAPATEAINTFGACPASPAPVK